MAAKIVFLDRALATHGSETAETREVLSRSVASGGRSHVAGRKVISNYTTGPQRIIGRSALSLN
jgi:hypothetical protein